MIYQFSQQENRWLTEGGDKETGLLVGCLSSETLIQAPLYANLPPLVQRFCRDKQVSAGASHRNMLHVAEDFAFGIMGVPDRHDLFSDQDLIGFYLAKNLFLCVVFHDEDDSVGRAFRDSVLKGPPGNGGMAGVFTAFLRQLLAGYNDIYDTFRKKLEDLDERVHLISGDDNAGLYREISQTHHQLLGVYGYYDALSDIVETLEAGETGIFSKSDLKHFGALSRRMNRYASNINLLRDYCTQIRAGYQAQLDINMNRIMKIFTVMTTIFLPLNLLVGWYGMNFKFMPELSWPYAYPVVIGLSLTMVAGCLIYFKKKNFWS